MSSLVGCVVHVGTCTMTWKHARWEAEQSSQLSSANDRNRQQGITVGHVPETHKPRETQRPPEFKAFAAGSRTPGRQVSGGIVSFKAAQAREAYTDRSKLSQPTRTAYKRPA